MATAPSFQCRVVCATPVPFYTACHKSLWNAFRFSFIFVLKHKSNQLNIALNDSFFCHTLKHSDLRFFCATVPEFSARTTAFFSILLHFPFVQNCVQVNQLNNLLVRAHALFCTYGFVSSHSRIEVSVGFLFSLRFRFLP